MPVRAPVAPTASWQSISLLLVEDDRADAVLVEDLIADAATDIRVVWAQSMAHAEQELAAARPDCVLLDLHLPDANGIDALDRIAKHDATVPIVVLTGLNDENFGASAVAAGAVGAGAEFVVRRERNSPRRAIPLGARHRYDSRQSLPTLSRPVFFRPRLDATCGLLLCDAGQPLHAVRAPPPGDGLRARRHRSCQDCRMLRVPRGIR